MARVVCSICKTGFDARISKEDYCVNCIACGVAFNAAPFLPPDEFLALSEDRPTLAAEVAPKPSPLATPVRAENTPAAQPALNAMVNAPFRVSARQPAAAFAQASAVVAMAETPTPAPQFLPAVAEVDEAVIQDKPRSQFSFLEASEITPRKGSPRLTAAPVPQTYAVPKAYAAPTPQLKPTSTSHAHVGINLSEEEPAEAPVLKASAPVQIPVPAHATPAAGYQSPVPLFKKADPHAATPTGSRKSGGYTTKRPLLEGQFGPFEIEGEIARGGVGAVFRARDKNTNRIVALKVLLDGEDADDLECERFRRECETAKALNLPGMVSIYSVGEVDGKPYMAMELIEGHSLDKIIPEKHLSVHDYLVMMQAVAKTVGALHEAGYVHRDLKPANILLDKYNTPKVADFGLVKSLDEVTRLTASGLVCGTPAYMAPEQARGEGKAVDPRTDVWALGAVLYEMLTAHPPFQADNALRLMLRITKDDPLPPRELNPKIPRDVEKIILKCLEKNGERRYTNGCEMAEDIQRFLDEKPVEAGRGNGVSQFVKAAREKPALWAAAAGGVVCVIVAVAMIRVTFQPKDTETLLQQAQQAWNEKRLGDAESGYNAVLKQDPKCGRAYLGLGMVYALQSMGPNQQLADAIKFEKAVSTTSKAKDVDQTLAADSAAQAARLYHAVGRFRDEVRELEHAVILRADSADLFQQLGLAYWFLGNTTRQRDYYQYALRNFNRVLTLRRDYPRTREFIKELQERYLVRGAGGSELSMSTNTD